MSKAGSAHYKTSGGIEPLDAILEWKLDFVGGNVVKYTMRARNQRPQVRVDSLMKAFHYAAIAAARAARERGMTKGEIILKMGAYMNDIDTILNEELVQ